MSSDLAQVNVSRLLAPLGFPQLAPFEAALAEVNAAGEAAAGFLWRLQTEDGNATAVKAFGWDVAGSHGVIVNLTTWTSVEALGGFVFSGPHLQIMRRRRQWFHRAAEATTALWWVPSGHRPSTDEAEDRVRQLRRDGPSADSFTFRTTFPAPGAAGRGSSLQRRLALPGLTGALRPGSRSALRMATATHAVRERQRPGGSPTVRRNAADSANSLAYPTSRATEARVLPSRCSASFARAMRHPVR